MVSTAGLVYRRRYIDLWKDLHDILAEMRDIFDGLFDIVSLKINQDLAEMETHMSKKPLFTCYSKTLMANDTVGQIPQKMTLDSEISTKMQRLEKEHGKFRFVIDRFVLAAQKLETGNWKCHPTDVVTRWNMFRQFLDEEYIVLVETILPQLETGYISKHQCQILLFFVLHRPHIDTDLEHRLQCLLKIETTQTLAAVPKAFRHQRQT